MCYNSVVMNRKANERLVNVDWKYYFICQKRQKKDIIDTDDILKTVANNITEYRNLGELDLDWNGITETVDENGNRTNSSNLYESLKKNQTCFHRTCGSKYNKLKLERLAKKRDEEERPSSSTSSTLSSIKKRTLVLIFVRNVTRQTFLKIPMLVVLPCHQAKCEHSTKQ